ncbi:MAG: hypothetical protein COA79_00180 [Planctomycetota bacterium]|nr:MAG: hypothetical protein COA79_00180 [Planctomycetota bacterium]
MTELPKISIITPSFNQAEFLEQTIQSVLDQNYPNLEYIIIDGGSTDNSVEIIKKYENSLTFWCSEKDSGQSNAINKGFSRATGEIVAWMNSDDFYHPNVFQHIAELWVNAEEKPGLIFGDGTRSNKEGNNLENFWPRKPFFDLNALIYGIDYILQPTTFMNREYLLEVGLLDEDLHYCMDYDLWIKLGSKYQVLTTEKVIANSREYESTKTNTGGFNRIEEMRKMIKRYQPLEITPGIALSLMHTFRDFYQNQNGNFFTRDSLSSLEELITEISVSFTAFSNEGDGWPSQTSTDESIQLQAKKGMAGTLEDCNKVRTISPMEKLLLKLKNLCLPESEQPDFSKEQIESNQKRKIEIRCEMIDKLIDECIKLNNTCDDRLKLIKKLHSDHKHAANIIEKTENTLPFKIYRKFKPR